ncbi:hypothetical protein [Hallella mizrahii]|uniref:Uncharacterized protein n=1 Tax=Hallella mizrahii TaxID=2606637 RepID=A0A7K0KHB7_9BACT|nr:hypothetical protein [Hallella mizrahii]MST85254.1 hypothetical protein [Hallella mizrahii]
MKRSLTSWRRQPSTRSVAAPLPMWLFMVASEVGSHAEPYQQIDSAVRALEWVQVHEAYPSE